MDDNNDKRPLKGNFHLHYFTRRPIIAPYIVRNIQNSGRLHAAQKLAWAKKVRGRAKTN